MCTPYAYACRGKKTPWVPFIECWPLIPFLRQSFSLACGLSRKARLAALSTPQTHLSPSTQHWHLILTFSFWWILGIELRSSYLQGQYFIIQDIYSVSNTIMCMPIFFSASEALMEWVNQFQLCSRK